MYILTDTTCIFVFSLATLFLSQPVILGRGSSSASATPSTKNDQSNTSCLVCCHGNRERPLLLKHYPMQVCEMKYKKFLNGQPGLESRVLGSQKPIVNLSLPF